MAGSRREKIGSIFIRMTGLLRSGALKEEDRPIWYDVVKALPPKPIPSAKPIAAILYPEDFVRVQFYRTFCEPVTTVLTNEKIKSVPQRFVDKYLELQSLRSVPTDQLFDETVRILKEQGVKLVTHQEKGEAEQARKDFMSYQVKENVPKEDYRKSLGASVMEDTRSKQQERTSEKRIDLDDLFKEKR